MASDGKILRCILGCGEFGKEKLPQDEQCHEIIDEFLAKGHKELDTAIMYANGKSEKIMGRCARCRDSTQVSIATKANSFTSLRHDSVIRQLETSLASLQVPLVDIFYLHWPDHETPIEETLSAVQELYTRGKFKEFGLSNFKSWEVTEIYYLCKQNGWVLPTVYQGMYNAVTRMVEAELFPCLRRFGIRFYAYNPLAGGVLTDNYQYMVPDEKQRVGRFWGDSTDIWRKAYRERYWRQSMFDGVQCVRASLDEVYGSGKVSVANAGIRWMVHHSQLDPKSGDGVILGVSSLKHARDNLQAFEDGPLEPGVVAAFEKAWQLDKANCATYYR